MTIRHFAPLGAAIMLSVAATNITHAQELGIKLGAKAPAAAVQTLTGKEANISQFIGKTPLVIEFWATWCTNCKELEPQLLSAVKKYSSQVKFLGVAVSANQSLERVKLYVDKYHYEHEMVYDRDGAAVTAYDVPATSYIVAINKNGTVVYTGVGTGQKLDDIARKAMVQ